jgi:diguanylate cyclase (GGDEF)-like protein
VTRWTLLLVVTLFGASAAVFWRMAPMGRPTVTATHIAWWALAVCFAASELLSFHIEFERQSHTVTFTEVALLLGVCCASPMELLVGELVGSGLFLLIRQHRSPLKATFNLGVLLFESSVSVLVFHGLAHGVRLENPHTWIVAIGALVVGDLASGLAVGSIIVIHAGRIEPRSLLLSLTAAAVTNSSLGLATLLLYGVHPAAIAFLGAIAAALYVGYRAYHLLARRYARLEALYAFTRQVSGAVQPADVLQTVLAQARQLLRAEQSDLHLVGLEQELAEFRRNTQSTVGGSRLAELLRHLPPAARATLFDEQRAVVVGRRTRSVADRALLEGAGVHDLLIAPVVNANAVIGVIGVANRESDVSTFDDDDARLFETLAAHAGVALENGRLIEELHEQARQREHEALHDPLTGLPNRALFQSRLDGAVAGARQREGKVAVLLMDLNGFKEVNDTLGHHCGDVLLQAVALRLQSVIRGEATVARLGGDEFTVLLPSVAEADNAVAVAYRLQDVFDQPFVVEGVRVEIGASIGVALWPDHGDDAGTLLRRADVAMYEAKGSSHRHTQLYQPGQDRNDLKRLTLAGELRHAIESGQLVVYYQPKADLHNAAIVGAEALVRWQHPERGLIPPDDFVPVAERTGLLDQLTDVVLRDSLAQCREWRRAGYELGVSVNISVRSLADPALAERIAQHLRAADLPGDALTLEITESSIMADAGRAITMLEKLARLGVRLSVDDFGTGYSSLSYLQRLPVHEMKIDKSFVFGMTSDSGKSAIVRSVVDLARNLGLLVVAEGVEDAETWVQLVRLGAHHAQGYYLSRPQPAEALASLLAEQARRSVPSGV